MMDADVRRTLDELIRKRGENYGSVSRLLGRNAAYMQQFIKRGVPRKLDEFDRRRLAVHFGVDEAVLGGAPAAPADHGEPPVAPSLVTLPSIGASGDGPLAFDEQWLRELSPSTDLAVLRVQGDAMSPTLADGDHVIVDRTDGVARLRDGIYVLEVGGFFSARRIAFTPRPGRVAVRCDNGVYPFWPDCQVNELNVIGRAVWTGRRIV